MALFHQKCVFLHATYWVLEFEEIPVGIFGLEEDNCFSKMNMNKRKVYVVPEVRIVEVCQENLMNNPTSWDDGSGNKKPIVEGNPVEESDNYAKWHGFNVWEDDIKY